MVVSILLIAIAISVIAIAIKLLLSIKKIAKQGVEVEGIVFDLKQSVSSDNNITYPIIRFLTQSNSWITEESKIGVIPGMYKKGKKVIVVYQNDTPNNFFIKDNLTYLIPFILIIVASVLIIVSVLRLTNI